jgi:hypothetical protein
MTKKSRRARPAPSAAVQPVRVQRPVRPVAAQSKAKAKEVDFAHEYHYVIEDLKRIGIIAIGLLVLLVVLALVIG